MTIVEADHLRHSGRVFRVVARWGELCLFSMLADAGRVTGIDYTTRVLRGYAQSALTTVRQFRSSHTAAKFLAQIIVEDSPRTAKSTADGNVPGPVQAIAVDPLLAGADGRVIGPTHVPPKAPPKSSSPFGGGGGVQPV